MDRLTRKLGPHPLLILSTALTALVFALLLLYLCIVLGRDRVDVGVNLLVALLGALSGWALGIFFSPIDARDARRLQFVGKTVGAFISGYLLAKVDPFLAEQVKLATETPSRVNWIRVGICATSGLLGAVVVFVNRAYSAPTGSERPQPSPSLAPGVGRTSGLKNAS
jgi:hypothetical protein